MYHRLWIEGMNQVIRIAQVRNITHGVWVGDRLSLSFHDIGEVYHMQG